MYFAIIGNHPQITLQELQIINPTEIKEIGPHLITFNTTKADKLPLLSSLIKRGEIDTFTEIEKKLSEKRILGIADKMFGINLKKKYNMKRFKQVDILHTDREVKNKGIELIKIKGEYGIVQGYQNIKLYEVVDFDKPARSMQTGMMPAKLTHTLINIGTSLLPKEGQGRFSKCEQNSQENILIFDPFCGTGTTGFLANALGYDFIGSDIKLNLALKNEERRKTTPYYHNQLFSFLDQDISKPLNKENFSALLTHQTLIITEGRLGPIIKQTTTPAEIKEYQRRVKNLYLQFIQTVTDFFPEDKRPPMVFTIPFYIGQENTIEQYIKELTNKLGRKMESLDEIYQRENQKIGRKIIILQ